MADDVLRIVVTGHTNAGKTSLLRTLTRQRHFGEISEAPGTTRHAESVDLLLDGRVAACFTDTPGLEDSIALLDFLQRQVGETRPQQVRAFLAGPEAWASFEQEAKVFRVLMDHADAAILVIDTREAVLPKFRAEIEALTWCARPIMPVLNFVRDPASRAAQWHQALQDSNLHARAEFDAVAPYHGAEALLYRDLGVLLPARRQLLESVVIHLDREADQRLRAGCRLLADVLIRVAAMRRHISRLEFEDVHQRQAFVQAFQDALMAQVQGGVQQVLKLYGFAAGDAELPAWQVQAKRWADDLFNPHALVDAGRQLGVGAAIGAGIGVVADLAVAGLSMGAATALGATVGGAASGGWRPLWRKLENRMQGMQELTADDALLLRLAQRLCLLLQGISRRGHAAHEPLRVVQQTEAADAALPAWRELIRSLAPARIHPDWERGEKAWASGQRGELQLSVAGLLLPLVCEESGTEARN